MGIGAAGVTVGKAPERRLKLATAEPAQTPSTVRPRKERRRDMCGLALTSGRCGTPTGPSGRGDCWPPYSDSERRPSAARGKDRDDQVGRHVHGVSIFRRKIKDII